MAVSFSTITQGRIGSSKLYHQQSEYEDNEFVPIVNAVEIDWNGATLSDANPNTGGATSAINDTAQLLDLINTMQKEIYVLTAAVIALAQR